MSYKINIPDEEDKFVDKVITRMFEEFASEPSAFELIPKIASPTMIHLMSIVAHTAFEILKEDEIRKLR